MVTVPMASVSDVTATNVMSRGEGADGDGCALGGARAAGGGGNVCESGGDGASNVFVVVVALEIDSTVTESDEERSLVELD